MHQQNEAIYIAPFSCPTGMMGNVKEKGPACSETETILGGKWRPSHVLRQPFAMFHCRSTVLFITSFGKDIAMHIVRFLHFPGKGAAGCE